MTTRTLPTSPLHMRCGIPSHIEITKHIGCKPDASLSSISSRSSKYRWMHEDACGFLPCPGMQLHVSRAYHPAP